MQSTEYFFSSRRRHTRSLRDWSSDVCSSDLRRSDRDDAPPLVERTIDRRGRGGPDRVSLGQIGRASCRGRSFLTAETRASKENRITGEKGLLTKNESGNCRSYGPKDNRRVWA